MIALLSNTPEPAVLFKEELDDLLIEAGNYLDGAAIETEEQASAISSLMSRARRVGNDADDARKLEKKPHDDAAKFVQACWKPILDKADLVVSTAKQALAPWLIKLEAQQRAEADTARVEADRLAQIATEALSASSGNLQARDDTERLLKAAGAADRQAAKLGKQKAHATGGERAVTLLDNWTPELVDSVEALRHYRTWQPDALKAWLVDQASKDVRAGARAIPGFKISNERIAR